MLTRLALPALPLLALAACTGSPDTPIADLIRRDLGQLPAPEERLLSQVAQLSRAVDPVPDAPTVTDYQRLARERNPRIAAARQKVLRLRERIPQESALPEPMLDSQPYGEMAQTAAGEMMWMVGISQEIPFPGKLSAMGAIAQQEAQVAVRQLQMVERQVIAETARAYWSLYAAERALELTRASRELLAQLQGAAEAQYRAGRTAQADLLRVNTELVTLDNDLLTLEQRRATAAGLLNSLIDRPITAEIPPAAPPGGRGWGVFESPDALDLDALLSRAAHHSPELASMREEIELARRQRKLAGLNRLPDFNAGIAYAAVDPMEDEQSGDDQWWFTFGLTIPIWVEKYSAAEREASRAMLEAIANLSSAQNRQAAMIQQALADVQTQQRTASVLRDAIIPQARQTLESSLASYRAGALDFATVAENWRRLLELQLMEHDALAGLGRALAELEELVGAELNTPTTPAAKEAAQ